MARLIKKHYEQRLMLAMLVYMVALIAAGPLLRAVASLPLKAMLAVAPVLPMLYVIALMWRRISDSDELEQRTHLVALGVATALVSALSMGGGFLVAGGVLHLGGDVLIWVFPVLMMGYGIAYRQVANRYGMGVLCTDEGSPWLPWYFAVTAVVMAAFGLDAWWKHNAWNALAFAATTALFVTMAVWVRMRQSRARRLERED
ncbi:hypothetical protein [Rhodanobacter geophilus]|uniref:Transmembrane protein n=1 Tax=Rhodanobacter geophilus TaxID=3162488 RepID=A0ABV3QJJ2_9GAMM